MSTRRPALIAERSAYQMRRSGHSWEAIGQQLWGLTGWRAASRASAAASRHALRYKARWPLEPIALGSTE